RFDMSQFKPEWVAPETADFARIYNDIAAAPHVVGVSTFQDITPAGDIVDRLSVTIASASGRTTVTRNDLAISFDMTGFFAAIAGISADLDAIEALSVAVAPAA